MRMRGVVLLLPQLFVFAGCSLLTSFDGFVGGTGADDAQSDVALDASTPPGDADASTPPGDADASDAPLPLPKPPCDATAKPAPGALFVSTMGDDALAGSAVAPVKTIGTALSLAAKHGVTDVYLDEGTYTEAVTIASPVTLHGGWRAEGATWSKDCSDTVAGSTIVRSPTARAVAVSGFSGTAGLDTMTLVTKAQAAPGESGIAVFVAGAAGRSSAPISFAMVGVDVTAAAGGDGVEPTQPAPAGNVTTSPLCSDGATGGPGTAGPKGEAGTFGASGYSPTNGGAGKVGTGGHAGTPGGQGSSSESCVISCGGPPSCVTGSTGGREGGRGTCGFGGAGGKGGGGGGSGGASIGVYVFGATLAVEHSTVRASRGGAGAPGALGGAGGTGTAGQKGPDGFCGNSCVYDGTQCLYSGNVLSGGSPGGPGGAGGAGGAGGGGAGGPSYGIVYAGGATVSIAPTTSIQVEAGGTGASGAPNGASAASFAP